MIFFHQGRTVFDQTDPRAAEYGTPRKETLLRLAEGAPAGCFVEFGVYQGDSAWRLERLATRLGRTLHLFDTFTGIPTSGEHDIIPVGHLGDVSLDEVRARLPNSIFHVGFFPDTMPNPFEPIAFCHIDCDQYAACLDAIEHFGKHMVPDGIMLFDDYNVTPGCRKAVDETFEHVTLTREGKAYVIYGLAVTANVANVVLTNAPSPVKLTMLT